MAETREQKLAREMSHRQSYSRMEPRLQRYLASSERDNPPIGLEDAGLLDPYGWLMGWSGAPAAAVKGVKKLGGLGAEAIARSVESGSPLTALARPAYAVKPKVGGVPPARYSEPDPLAQVVAARMVGQLNAVPQVGGLESLRGINLPAAYAGDQRSLKAAQRAISEAETGLQSPGRRKLLKQAAATAARSAVPDTLVEGLGANALRTLADVGKAPVAEGIPVESMQAAISSALDSALAKLVVAKKKFGAGSQEYEDAVASLSDSLDPRAVAKSFNLPEDQVVSFVDDTGSLPSDVFEDWAYGDQTMDAFYDSRSSKWLRDWVDGPGNTGGQAMDDAWKRAREILEAGDDDPVEYIIEAWERAYPEQYLGPVNKLLGKGAGALDSKYGEHFMSPQSRIHQMVGSVLEDEYDSLYEGVMEGLR